MALNDPLNETTTDSTAESPNEPPADTLDESLEEPLALSLDESLSPDRRVDMLYRVGKSALLGGRRKLAHDLWHEALSLDPRAEHVWVALLDVLDDEADRRVCLQNILALNPDNHAAEREYGRMRREREKAYETELLARQQERARQYRRALKMRRLIIIIGVVGMLGGLIASILIYGL